MRPLNYVKILYIQYSVEAVPFADLQHCSQWPNNTRDIEVIIISVETVSQNV